MLDMVKATRVVKGDDYTILGFGSIPPQKSLGVVKETVQAKGQVKKARSVHKGVGIEEEVRQTRERN